MPTRHEICEDCGGKIQSNSKWPSWLGPVLATVISLSIIYVGTLLYWAGTVNTRMDNFEKRMGSFEQTLKEMFKPAYRGPVADEDHQP